jgi:SAM-dependent methyltransferase
MPAISISRSGLKRTETILGQTSWATLEESNEIPDMLALAPSSYVLEIGYGAGRYALQIAAKTGCRVLGVDINRPGIQTARQLAEVRSISGQVRFDNSDVAKTLPFANATFDAAFANDVLCHIAGRLSLLIELFRVLRAGGRFLFSDGLVIGGMISHQEIAIRSSIGYYVFGPPGENERLLEKAGFRILRVVDTSRNAAALAKRWRDAREKRHEALLAIEGEENFSGLQQFLSTVHDLTGEGRLQRFVYLAERRQEQ